MSFTSFADDIILLSLSNASLTEKFNILSSKLIDSCLSISIKKCPYFLINDNNHAEQNCNSTSFPVSDTVLFLGLPISRSILIFNIQEIFRKAFRSIIQFSGI